ncbi:hypothetical protein ABPG75_013304 [Micractinium tetrahymenae]
MRAVLGSSSAPPGGGATGGSGPPSPGVSSVEVYGFVGWITSSVAYVLFLLWAYTPDHVLEAHGITYYPSKWWALALPAWACATVVFAFWLYESLCMMSAPPPGAPSTLRDRHSRSREAVGLASYFCGVGKGIPPLVDIPPELVSMVLHGGLAPLEVEHLFDKQRRRRGATLPSDEEAREEGEHSAPG